MKKILFLYKTPRKQIYEEWKQKSGPDTSLYGLNHIKKFGVQADFFDYSFSIVNPIRWICYPIHLVAARTTGIGFNLGQALTLLPVFANYDLVVSTMDSAGLPILLLKKLKLIKKPIIYISVDLIEKLNRQTKKWPFSIYKDLLAYADCIICYSKREQALFEKYNSNVHFMPIGVDVDFFKNSKRKRFLKKTKPVIVAFGRDRDRDYKTFISAVKKGSIGVIVTGRSNTHTLNIPKNFKIYYDLSPKNLRNRIWQSDVIVIPVKNVARAAGQLSLLDALSSKKPVIVAKIPGITETYDLVDGKDCLYYQPGNSRDLKTRIRLLLQSPKTATVIATNGQKKEKKYSTKAFAAQLNEVFKSFYLNEKQDR